MSGQICEFIIKVNTTTNYVHHAAYSAKNISCIDYKYVFRKDILLAHLVMELVWAASPLINVTDCLQDNIDVNIG